MPMHFETDSDGSVVCHDAIVTEEMVADRIAADYGEVATEAAVREALEAARDALNADQEIYDVAWEAASDAVDRALGRRFDK